MRLAQSIVQSGPRRFRRRANLLAAAAAALALTAVACGTRVDPDTLRLAAGSFVGEPVAAPDSLAPAADGQASSALPGAPGLGGSGRTSSPAGDARTSAAAFGVGTGGRGESSSTAPGRSEILLGAYGTGSGIIGAQLAAIPVAVRAWVASVNASGGINGHPVRVLFGDDGGDPGRALSIVRNMVERDKVIALVGTYGATTSQAVLPYLETKKVPQIGGGGNPADDKSPMVFYPQISNSPGVPRSYLMSLTVQTKIRKVALLYCRESASCNATQAEFSAYAPKVGVEVVYKTQMSFAQPDYTAEVLAARNAGAEAVAVNADFATMVRVQNTARRQGWNPVFFAGIALDDDGFAQACGNGCEGTLAAAATVPYTASRRMADYRAAVARYVPGGRLGGTGASAWTQGKLFEIVAGKVGGKPTTKQILEGLWALRNETVGERVAPVTFPRARKRGVNLCAVPIRFTNGRFVAPLGDSFFCGTDSGVRQL